MSARRITPLGDTARLVEIAPVLSLDANREAVALAASVRAAALPGVRDVVVAGAAVAVHVDPLIASLDVVDALLQAPVALDQDDENVAGREAIVIPVRYGGEDGPDLEAVAAATRCSVDEVVARHSGVTYRVTMMGFVPGFGYLWPLDERLRLPRRDLPRTRVPAGSVAIAGAQTAVYPSETPGGWHLIGRTDVVLCDYARPAPFLFEVGRAVRFVRR